jgi:hypothetical protein
MDQPQTGTGDRAYFAQRAAEELELSLSASDSGAAEAHKRMQRFYTERASIGSREKAAADEIVG